MAMPANLTLAAERLEQARDEVAANFGVPTLLRLAAERIQALEKLGAPDRLDGAEILFGFVAWLTTRYEVTTFSARHITTTAHIRRFCEANGMAMDCRPDWSDRLTHPVVLPGEDDGSKDGDAPCEPVTVAEARVQEREAEIRAREARFRVGDKVQATYGGPTMTVTTVPKDGCDAVHCSWWPRRPDGGWERTPGQGMFGVSTLVPVMPESNPDEPHCPECGFFSKYGHSPVCSAAIEGWASPKMVLHRFPAGTIGARCTECGVLPGHPMSAKPCPVANFRSKEPE